LRERTNSENDLILIFTNRHIIAIKNDLAERHDAIVDQYAENGIGVLPFLFVSPSASVQKSPGSEMNSQLFKIEPVSMARHAATDFS
jgi:hypothetical protein